MDDFTKSSGQFLSDIQVLKNLEQILLKHSQIGHFDDYECFQEVTNSYRHINGRKTLSNKLSKLIDAWLFHLSAEEARVLAWLDGAIRVIDFEKEILPYFLRLPVNVRSGIFLRLSSKFEVYGLLCLQVENEGLTSLNPVFEVFSITLRSQADQRKFLSDGFILLFEDLNQEGRNLVLNRLIATEDKTLIFEIQKALSFDDIQNFLDKLKEGGFTELDFAISFVVYLGELVTRHPKYHTLQYGKYLNPELEALERKILFTIRKLNEDGIALSLEAYQGTRISDRALSYLTELHHSIQLSLTENQPKEVVDEKTREHSFEQVFEQEVVTDEDNREEEILKVNYRSSFRENSGDFPVLLIPKTGAVVRSYAVGKGSIRGHKEVDFEQALLKEFDETFEVLGNVRLNVSDTSDPYEPDIALISKQNPALRINIEIDEPYASISRRPIHCIGEDDSRNAYFRNRGWVVIRFTEKQVHEQELACLRFIANFISSIVFESGTSAASHMSSALELSEEVIHEEFWSAERAHQWSKERYREKYLNHDFGFVQTPDEVEDKALSDKERIEESLVEEEEPFFSDSSSSMKEFWNEPQAAGGTNGKKSSETATSEKEDQTISRDDRVQFIADRHEYYVDGIRYKSVTEFLEGFFEPFDAERIAHLVARKRGGSPEDYIMEWNEAKDKGTQLHKDIEAYFRTGAKANSPDFNFFLSFHGDHNNFKPREVEKIVFDEEFELAGTLDCIFEWQGKTILCDWKRSKNVYDQWGSIKTENMYQAGFPPISHIDDTSFNRYVLQQNLYKFIVERNYDLQIDEMWLVVIHPSYNQYRIAKVSDANDSVRLLLGTI